MYGKGKAQVTTTRMAAHTLCAAFVLVLLAGGANAETLISSCTTISEPGEYRLTADIINNTYGSCINITTSDVIFDGAGHMIDSVVPSHLIIFDGESGGILVYNKTNVLTNVTIKNLKVTDWTNGINFIYSNGKIENNTASSNLIGINLKNSTNSNLDNNSLCFNDYDGLWLIESSNNTITNNTISFNNQCGLFLQGSSNNILTDNVANSNLNDGIQVVYSSNNNTIYNNRFSNTINFDISSSNNTWNTTKILGPNIIKGPYLGGNYWGDPSGTGFSQTCLDGNSDGICDSPYLLDSSNSDYLPLANNTGQKNISTCTTINYPGYYILTSDIINSSAKSCINITSSDVVFDGVGHTIDGLNSLDTYGVNVYSPTTTLTNVTIKNVYLTDWSRGIFYNNTINGNIANNSGSFYLIYSNNNKLINNTGRVYLSHSNDNTLVNNIVNNEGPGIGLDNSENNTLIGNTLYNNIVAGIALTSSDNNTLENNTAYSNQNGIYISYSIYNTVINNTVNSNTLFGISLECSNLTILTNNTANLNSRGLDLVSSNDNTFINNTVTQNTGPGIQLGGLNNYNIFKDNKVNLNSIGFWLREFDNNNTLTNNTINSNNGWGIRIDYSNNHTITNNIVSLNSDFGIFFDSSNNNTIFNNHFINTNNFYTTSSNNTWNSTKTPGPNIIGGPYLGGNLWVKPNGTGFSQTCVDENGDGICDSSYSLDPNNTDYLPLKLKLANITGFGFGAGNGAGTPGSWINATVNVTNLDIVTHTYVIVVSGVSIDGYPLATTATLTLIADQSMSNIPVLVSIPPTTPPGSYNLIAGIWKLEDFPISSRLITSMGPITATVT